MSLGILSLAIVAADGSINVAEALLELSGKGESIGVSDISIAIGSGGTKDTNASSSSLSVESPNGLLWFIVSSSSLSENSNPFLSN